MTRRHRTRILIEGSPGLADRLADQANTNHDIGSIDEPSNGLVMMRLRDTARKDAFYLGEVLVTECKVRIGDCIGIGLVRGDRPELARNLAAIDAAWAADSQLLPEWIRELEAEEGRIRDRLNREATRILATRVDFSTMETF